MRKLNHKFIIPLLVAVTRKNSMQNVTELDLPGCSFFKKVNFLHSRLKWSMIMIPCHHTFFCSPYVVKYYGSYFKNTDLWVWVHILTCSFLSGSVTSSVVYRVILFEVVQIWMEKKMEVTLYSRYFKANTEIGNFFLFFFLGVKGLINHSNLQVTF